MRNAAFYKPNTVQIELVQGCNRHCSFCGTNGFEHKLYFIEKPLTKLKPRAWEKSGITTMKNLNLEEYNE